MGGISIWQLLIVFAIIILLFGTKKLRNIGGDLGSAIKGFKKAVNEDKDPKSENAEKTEATEQLAEKTDASEPKTPSEKTKEKDQA